MSHFDNKAWFHKVPVMVSYPRCGSNWLQAVMELYFNRHRAGKGPNNPSWVDKIENDDEPMWTATHDQSEQMNFDTDQPVLYLWRDPVDVLFSLFRLPNSLKFTNARQIEEQAKKYGMHYKKWTERANEKEVLILRYEDVLENPHREMERISLFFEKPFDLERSKMAFETVGDKKTTNSKNGWNDKFINKQSHTEEYAKARNNFKNEWGKRIVELSGVPTRYEDLKK